MKAVTPKPEVGKVYRFTDGIQRGIPSTKGLLLLCTATEWGSGLHFIKETMVATVLVCPSGAWEIGPHNGHWGRVASFVEVDLTEQLEVEIDLGI